MSLLPTTVNKDHEPERISLVGIDLTKRPAWVQFTALSLAIFTFYCGYGYMQELMFKLDGMQPFGWYLTLVQFVVYTLCGFTERRLWNEGKRRIPLRMYCFLAILTVCTMGFSNAAVGYLNYPTQVVFKCCKLIPVLIGGILIQGKRYGLLDLIAAALMSIGLAWFTLADSHVSPLFDMRGYTMISCALLADAVIGNVQEKTMKRHGASENEVVLYSYSIGFFLILIYTILSGEFFAATSFWMQHPKITYGYTLIFGLLGYLGVNVVLTMVRRFGALLAVTVTTLRKALTIILSFLLFSKPFTLDYVWSGLVVLFAIYLNLYSKNKKAWDARFYSIYVRWRQRRLSSTSSISPLFV